MADAMSDRLEVADYNPRFREYGSIIHDGGTAVLRMSHCPFCGAALPDSVRDRWFDVIEGLGFEPGDSGIPESLLTDEWWQEAT